MSRAALYLRVSTDEQKSSLDAQESGARIWCETHGHTVTHVYRDEAVSGAEWVLREGVLTLQGDACREPPPFTLVVVRDLDRLGRDAVRLPLLLHTLSEHGVTVVEWSTGRVVEIDGAGALVVNVLAAASAYERQLIAHRVRVALKQKAVKGLVTGGIVFGYVNVRGPEGVRYEIHEGEAAIVRELFERHAAGESARRLAQLLNARGTPSPRSEGGGTGSWCSRTVLAILRSRRYRGEATWGQVGSRYRGGSRERVLRADAVHYNVPVIVDSETWDRAQERTDKARGARQRPVLRGPEPRYLLVGHAVCDHCGGPLAGWRSTSGSGERRRVVPSYRCLWHADRGDAVCAARYCRPVDTIDRALLGQIAAALDPARVRAQVRCALELLRASAEKPDDRRAELEAAERAALQRVERLMVALEHGAGDVVAVVERLRASNADLTRTRAELAAMAISAPAAGLDVEERLVALARDVSGAIVYAYDRAMAGELEAMRRVRRLLAAVLSSPLRVRQAEPRGPVTVTGKATPGALLVAEENTGGIGATPMGIEPMLPT
jgi:DNA invertase Pin-like site-specific DNA recombinase